VSTNGRRRRTEWVRDSLDLLVLRTLLLEPHGHAIAGVVEFKFDALRHTMPTDTDLTMAGHRDDCIPDPQKSLPEAGQILRRVTPVEFSDRTLLIGSMRPLIVFAGEATGLGPSKAMHYIFG
jgi:hypothetical protein